MKIKNLFIITVLILIVIFGCEIAFLKIDKSRSFSEYAERYLEYYPIIEKGLNLYTPERLKNLRQDEYLFINEIVGKRRIKNIDLSYLKNKYEKDVFRRMLSKDIDIPNSQDIKIEKKNIVEAIGKPFEGNFYSIKNVDKINYDLENFGIWNDIIIKSIYCDKTGFDNGDFHVLKLLKNGDGGYFDTHYLFGLLFLKKNNCYAKEDLDRQIEDVSKDIAIAIDNDKIFSDLYVERIVFLYWSGYGNLIKKEQIDFIKNNFNEKYGWAEKKGTFFNGHISGLSLLSLIYYAEGKSSQSFYEN